MRAAWSGRAPEHLKFWRISRDERSGPAQVTETFNSIDKDNNGHLDFKEIKSLLEKLGDPDVVTDERAEELRKQLDVNKDNVVDRDEFTKWYIASESRLRAETKKVFDRFDANGETAARRSFLSRAFVWVRRSPQRRRRNFAGPERRFVQTSAKFRSAAVSAGNGKVEVAEVERVVATLADNCPRLQGEVAGAVAEFKTHLADGEDSCDYKAFEEWYESTIFWKVAKHDAEEAAETAEGMYAAVMDGIKSVASGEVGGSEAAATVVLFPLNFALAVTVPDCRVPGKEKWAYARPSGDWFWICSGLQEDGTTSPTPPK